MGDDFGGGNAVAVEDVCNVDAPAFSTVKAANFAVDDSATGPVESARGLVFRYALSARGCDEGRGGWAETPGNDLLVFDDYFDDLLFPRADGLTLAHLKATTFMHELGHTLGLLHGGDVKLACKPNYLSVMGYSPQLLARSEGGTKTWFVDYSPPRWTEDGSVRNPLLPALDEENLDEVEPFGTDPAQLFDFYTVFSSPVEPYNTVLLSQWINWDGDDPPEAERQIAPVDIDNPWDRCENVAFDVLRDHDDWTAISLPFRQFVAANNNIGFPPAEEPAYSSEELLEFLDAINTSDLAVTKSADVDTAVAGGNVTYTVRVSNLGPNPALGSRVTDTLPAGATLVSAPAACTTDATSVVCELGLIEVGASLEFSITVDVDAGFAYGGTGAPEIVNRVRVENLVGPDPVVANDTDQTTTPVIAVADLSIASFVISSAPAQLLVGESANVQLTKVLENLGPSSPIDATLVPTASSDSGLTASFLSQTGSTAGLDGTARSVTEVFSVRCLSPGLQGVAFANEIRPASAFDVDPDWTNNQATTARYVLECVLPVAINIKPGSNPNSFHSKHPSVPVAILTTEAGEYDLPLAFDAVTVVPSTVRFGTHELVWTGLGSRALTPSDQTEDSYERSLRPEPESTQDGDLDRILRFPAEGSGIETGETVGCVWGTYVNPVTSSSYPFFGCDDVEVKK